MEHNVHSRCTQDILISDPIGSEQNLDYECASFKLHARNRGCEFVMRKFIPVQLWCLNNFAYHM